MKATETTVSRHDLRTILSKKGPLDLDGVAKAAGGDFERAKFLAYRSLQGLEKGGEVKRMADGTYKLLKAGQERLDAEPKATRKAPAKAAASKKKNGGATLKVAVSPMVELSVADSGDVSIPQLRAMGLKAVHGIWTITCEQEKADKLAKALEALGAGVSTTIIAAPKPEPVKSQKKAAAAKGPVKAPASSKAVASAASQLSDIAQEAAEISTGLGGTVTKIDALIERLAGIKQNLVLGA